jgi:hypothetical protein
MRKEPIEWDILHGGRERTLLQQCLCRHVFPLPQIYTDRMLSNVTCMGDYHDDKVRYSWSWGGGAVKWPDYQGSNGLFEVFTAVTMKSSVLWDVTCCENRRFGGT